MSKDMQYTISDWELQAKYDDAEIIYTSDPNRASVILVQNREYVEEFCDTALYMEDGWLNVVFEFNNNKLDNLDPEISFKGRCKRFLSLFDIANLDEYLKIRVTIVGKLPTDENE